MSKLDNDIKYVDSVKILACCHDIDIGSVINDNMKYCCYNHQMSTFNILYICFYMSKLSCTMVNFNTIHDLPNLTMVRSRIISYGFIILFLVFNLINYFLQFINHVLTFAIRVKCVFNPFVTSNTLLCGLRFDHIQHIPKQLNSSKTNASESLNN